MRSDADRVNDLLAAIAKIGSRRVERFESFDGNEMLQVWVIHHLQVIGEAARGVSQPLKDSHPEVPWAQLVALRNILVHEYFGLNLHQVWMMTQDDLPRLDEQLRAIRRELSPEAGSEPG
jgi:uncharacterized protein with HEPN domain